MYFSDTVWVFRSSSLPVRDGALESSNGDANGPYLESRLAPDSELQLVRRDERPEGDRKGDSSLYGRVRDFLGGRSSSADSATPAFLYSEVADVGDRKPGLCIVGAVPGRASGCVSDRGTALPEVLGR